jgi:hypothetical protein
LSTSFKYAFNDAGAQLDVPSERPLGILLTVKSLKISVLVLDLFGELNSNLLLRDGPRTLAQNEELSLILRPKLLLPRIDTLVLSYYLFRKSHVLEHLLYPMEELLPALILNLTDKLKLSVK